MSLCNRCLNDCKSIRSISACRSYYNPARRQFDWRCRICNKKVPKLKKLCLEHQTWLFLLQKTFGFLGLISRFRDSINKHLEKLEVEQ